MAASLRHLTLSFTRRSTITVSDYCQQVNGHIARSYQRFSRRPVRVYNEDPQQEDIIGKYEEEIAQHTNQFKRRQSKRKSELLNAKEVTEKKDVYLKSKHRFAPQKDDHREDEDELSDALEMNLKDDLQYIKFSDCIEKIRVLPLNAKSRKLREKKTIFMAEGARLVKEALDTGMKPEAIFFSRLDTLLKLCSKPSESGSTDLNYLNELPLYKTPYKTMQGWSSLTTCPGIIGIFRIPETTSRQVSSKKHIPLTVIIDGISHPGNLGGVLRIAASVGAQQVLLMKGCCDPWEAKALRGGCGAQFHVNVTSKVTWDIIGTYIPENSNIILADICQELDLDCISHSEEMHNRLMRSEEEMEMLRASLDEDMAIYDVDSEGNRIMTDISYTDEEHISKFKNVTFPVFSFDDVQFFPQASTCDHSVVVIGSETGMSNAAKKFAYVNGGKQVSVPVAQGLDSLNVGVATGIILYEALKQYRVVNPLKHIKPTDESNADAC